MKEQREDRIWIFRILGALGVLAVIMVLSLYLHGIQPLSEEARSIFEDSVETVLNDSTRRIADIQNITNKEAESVISTETGQGSTSSSAGSSAQKAENKETRQTQRAVKKVNDTVENDMDDLIYVIADYLPGWIPYREYMVAISILLILLGIILILNRYF